MHQSGTTVTYSAAELERIRAKAAQRNEIKARWGVPTQKIDGAASDEDVHVKGLMGEVAVASLLGISADGGISPDGDDGHDLALPCGARIDVKTRSRLGQDLALYGPDDRLGADLAVLCYRLSTRSVEAAGWISRALWKIRREMLSFGGAPRPGVSPEALRPMPSLMGAIS